MVECSLIHFQQFLHTLKTHTSGRGVQHSLRSNTIFFNTLNYRLDRASQNSVFPHSPEDQIETIQNKLYHLIPLKFLFTSTAFRAPNLHIFNVYVSYRQAQLQQRCGWLITMIPKAPLPLFTHSMCLVNVWGGIPVYELALTVQSYVCLLGSNRHKIQLNLLTGECAQDYSL